MNWKQRLFKPKWQNKSADIRLESVTNEQHPELINSLLEIAGTDEDSQVRCAAIKRLHQLENILKLYANETDPRVKTLLESRIHQLAASTNESRPPLEFRLQVVQLSNDRTLIEHIAGHAPEAVLRRAALEKVTRQGVLGDCCIEDSKADNRRFAASRISQHTTLKRVIDALRKRDKTLYSELQTRLHKELLEAADPKAVQAEALRICTTLEHMALETDKADKSETKALHAAWQGIAGNASTAMADRYQRICERLVAPKEPSPPPPPSKPVVTTTEPTPVKEVTTEIIEAPHANDELVKVATDICLYEVENPDYPKAVSINKLKHQLEKAWAQCTPPHADDLVAWGEANTALAHLEATIEKQQQLFEKELGQAQELLTRMEAELEQGELHKALESRAKLLQSTKGHGKNKDWQKINNKLSGMQARLRELRDWHHWSNNKIRKRLIAEMEVLPAADLHPDALLDRIKSLQVEWKTLEQSEQIPGDKHFAAAPWMWRKFSAAGHTAFDTAKPYLDKRSEIQSRHAQSLATFCAELEQLAQSEPMDWTALGKGLNRGRKKLHDLNNLPANQRQKFARKLKATLDKANGAMQEHYQAVERDKMKLIRAASQLIHMPERSEAITQAKSLQSNWQAAGSLWRSKEQELWNQFREHLDPLFEELKEQQASIRVANEENLSAQKALCTEMKEILKSDDDLSAQHGKVQGLQDAWKDIEHPDRKLVQSFQLLVEDYQQRVKKSELQQIDEDRERRWLKSALLHELTVTGRTAKGALSKKAESKVTKAWPEDSSDEYLEKTMDQACAALLAGQTADSSDDEIEELKSQARILAIRLEFVAGLPSPDEDRDQRMQYQVDRLAESMSGESARQPATDEARDAEITWLGMYALPEPEFKAFGKRIKQALAAIRES
jgi:exonuclease SbcC